MIDVIMPVLDRQDETVGTLESLFCHNKNINVIIVDNGSDDSGYLNKWDVHVVKSDRNIGVSKAFNRGLNLAESGYIVLMHNDIVVDTDNWIEKAISFMENNEKAGMVGIAGFRRLMRSVEVTNVVTGIDKYVGTVFKHARSEFVEVTVLDGCCIMARNVGLRLDENLDYYFYDWDLSLQYRKAGYSLYAMDSKATHFADDRTKATNRSAKYKSLHADEELYNRQSKEYFLKKWNGYIPEETVVTANIGGVDNPIEKHFDNPGFRYVMFTDDKNMKSPLWNMKYITPEFQDTRREARMYKWLIHRFFPCVRYSLWIDSNVVIMSKISTLLRYSLADADIALPWHPVRDCIYEEGKACIEGRLDNVKTMETQLERYKAEGYPAHNGLHQTRVMMRRHTKEINALNEAIWGEICAGSLRDQLCFNYMAWKMGIEINTIPGEVKIYTSIDCANISDPYNFGLIWPHSNDNRVYGQEAK